MDLLLKEDEIAPKEGGVYILYLFDANRGTYIFKITKVPDRLPGSGVSVAEAKKEALYIVEAKILRLGERGEAPDGGLAYPQILVEPLNPKQA